MAESAEAPVVEQQPTGGNPASTAADPASPAPAETPAVNADGSAKLDTQTPEEKAEAARQAEIDRIVYNRVERERRARERAEVEADTLRKLVVPPQQQAATKADVRPDQKDFDDYNEYLRADARYEARQEFKALQEAQQKQQQEQTAQQAKMTVHQKFGAALEKAAETNPAFFDNYDRVARLNYAQGTDIAMHDAIADSDRAADLLGYLATNVAEADRIAKLSPQRAVMELGKIEAGLGAPKKVAVSNAPAPITPVGTARATVPADEVTGDESPDEYRRKREAQMAKRGQR